MPQIYLCFLWHMHQPFYKDLISGQYKLPWTRLHASKDYYGMAQILEEFPQVRQTFNLVPSMMAQVKEYASGKALSPYLELALVPAEDLTAEERDFLLKNAFNAHPGRMIYRYPRYAELYETWKEHKSVIKRVFSAQDYRDLQVLSQIAWFDEEFLQSDQEVIELVSRGRDFTLTDQKFVVRKQREIISKVLPTYKRLAGSGQIEISTTPYYHPILPLICDSNIAGVSDPNVPLPPRFRYPEDARIQLERARNYVESEFGVAPVGLWPSEGSVSDEVFEIAADAGFRWAATDSGVLARTLGQTVGVDTLYRLYRWCQPHRQLNVIFRDHFLSDLIGFVYSHMDARAAAEDFLHRIRENCRGILASGRDALVPIILDGENAWEYYDRNGRPFLRELYAGISNDDRMIATTISDALQRIESQTLQHIFPGSWINANFDIWIGAEEDNAAWTQLLRARETYDLAKGVPEEKRRLAYEELLVAEGSDWCWWYGPEHDSGQRPEFDQLFRSHLANVYRALELTPPEELSRPILRLQFGEVHTRPTGAITPAIDGEVTSYFEWLGAGMYRVDERSGSMHGKKFLVQEVQYGTDGSDLFIRVDFFSGAEQEMSEMELRLTVESGDPPRSASAVLRLDHGVAHATHLQLACQHASKEQSFDCAFRKILEIRISLDALGGGFGAPVRFQFSLWQGGLPIDAVPQQGWLGLASTNPTDWE